MQEYGIPQSHTTAFPTYQPEIWPTELSLQPFQGQRYEEYERGGVRGNYGDSHGALAHSVVGSSHHAPPPTEYDPHHPNLFGNFATTGPAYYPSNPHPPPPDPSCWYQPSETQQPSSQPPPQPPQPSSTIFDFSILQAHARTSDKYSTAVPRLMPRPQAGLSFASSSSTSSSQSSNSPTPSSSSSTVLIALTNRASFLEAPHPLPSIPAKAHDKSIDSRRGRPREGSEEKVTSTSCLVLHCTCLTCGEPIATINMRDLKGKGKRRPFQPQRAIFTCFECSPSFNGDNDSSDTLESFGDEDQDNLSYKDTLSAAVNSMSGLALDSDITIRPPVTRVWKNGLATR